MTGLRPFQLPSAAIDDLIEQLEDVSWQTSFKAV